MTSASELRGDYYVYFILAESVGRVKIGFSGNPLWRCADLSQNSPVYCRLIGCLKGEPRVEKEWHKRFDHLRIRGEWFEYTGELKAAIEEALATDVGFQPSEAEILSIVGKAGRKRFHELPEGYQKRRNCNA